MDTEIFLRFAIPRGKAINVQAYANGIQVGLGNDASCPFVSQYDTCRELEYIVKYIGVLSHHSMVISKGHIIRNPRIKKITSIDDAIEKILYRQK